MKYGYCRVSTVGQDLKEQEDALVALGVPKANIFKEKISGVIRSDDRPQFGKLLKKIQAGDELVVMKLDRLGRSTLDILTVIQNLRGQGIAITIEGVGSIRDDMMGSLTMNLLASFAEFGRALIIDRTQSGRKREPWQMVCGWAGSLNSPARPATLSGDVMETRQEQHWQKNMGLACGLFKESQQRADFRGSQNP